MHIKQMLKKICIALIMITSIFMLQNSVQAWEVEEPGLRTILFEENSETIIHKCTIHELWYTLIKLHTLVAGKNLVKINYQWEELEAIKNIEELTKTNIIQLLNIADNKQEALSEYLNTVYRELNKWDTIAAYLKQEMEIIKSDIQAYNIDKQISDKMYFEAMNMYDQKIMEISLKESIQYEKYSSEKRIQYNAKASIINKLVFYLWLLQKKYDILFDKQEILAKNFEIFRDNILPELNEINALIHQYNL